MFRVHNMQQVLQRPKVKIKYDNNCNQKLQPSKVETRNTNTSYTWIWAEAEIVLNLKQNNKHAKMIHLLCSYYMYTSINTECHCHVHHVIT